MLGVTDPDGDPVTTRIVSVHQDEPTNGLGDGDTGPDAALLADGSADVRAERSGKADGRVYYLGVTADDGAGGTCETTVQVSVPHSRSAAAFGGGPLFDSTVSWRPSSTASTGERSER